MLGVLKAGCIITDATGRRDIVHMRLSTPTVFIRYVGNNRHVTDFKRVDEWAGRLKTWIDAGIESLYFMMHQHQGKGFPGDVLVCNRTAERTLRVEAKTA